MSKPFLEAEWRNLIMVNYVVDPKILEPYLPAGTTVDLFHGKAYVSLVGFLFAETKVLGVKIPFHINFEEVNLRFYVTHEGKRGVVFIKEIVPKAAISFVANNLFGEKYATAPMKHFFLQAGEDFVFSFQWKSDGRWNMLEAVTETHAVEMPPGSEEEFIAEHYYGYSRKNERTTFEYEVKHPRWRVFPVIEYTVNTDFAGLYGDAFAALKDSVPASVFVAQGSAISVGNKRRLPLI
ncbi:MAG: uncharacterized protein JWQ27_2229 [Ferruginibacter sp.]|nr:uncharacterized protein [Ferruginibacter sp.]